MQHGHSGPSQRALPLPRPCKCWQAGPSLSAARAARPQTVPAGLRAASSSWLPTLPGEGAGLA
eukprot:scaffold73610_cov20-Tisochrysis_lutea.AAC.4